MRSITLKWMMILAVLCPVSLVGAQETQVLKTEQDKVNYGIGVGMAKNLQRQGVEVDVDLVVRGLRDALSGKKLLMSDEELQTTMTKFETDFRQKQGQAAKAALEKNKKAGDVFLAENKKKPGVITLPSGLQYSVLKQGSGKIPKDTDTVECLSRGTLVDGTEFDATYRSGKPISLAVKDVIPGWKEALTLMPVGSKWQLVIPPELAYREQGWSNLIGPGATLVFEVELVAIK